MSFVVQEIPFHEHRELSQMDVLTQNVAFKRRPNSSIYIQERNETDMK